MSRAPGAPAAHSSPTSEPVVAGDSAYDDIPDEAFFGIDGSGSGGSGRERSARLSIVAAPTTRGRRVVQREQRSPQRRQ